MATDNRAQALETKRARDQDDALELKARTLRNRQIGAWAGGLMGLEGAHLDDYANAVARTEADLPSDEDVLRKVAKDLSASGLKVSEGVVMGKMQELMAFARDELKSA